MAVICPKISNTHNLIVRAGSPGSDTGVDNVLYLFDNNFYIWSGTPRNWVKVGESSTDIQFGNTADLLWSDSVSDSGSGDAVSRANHRHKLPDLPYRASTALPTELAFGSNGSLGITNTIARGDHTHGLPALPAASNTVAGVLTIPVRHTTSASAQSDSSSNPGILYVYDES